MRQRVFRRFINSQRRGFALHCHRVNLAQSKVALDPRRRLRPDDNAAAIDPGQALQPGRDVHGVADNRVLEMCVRAEAAGDRTATIHADAEGDRRITARHAAYEVPLRRQEERRG